MPAGRSLLSEIIDASSYLAHFRWNDTSISSIRISLGLISSIYRYSLFYFYVSTGSRLIGIISEELKEKNLTDRSLSKIGVDNKQLECGNVVVCIQCISEVLVIRKGYFSVFT